MLGWLTLAHVAPRRRPIIMRTRTIFAEGVDFDSLASRRCVRKLEDNFEAEETRFDTARRYGGVAKLTELVASGHGWQSIVDHVTKVAALPPRERLPAKLHALLEAGKSKPPVLHKGCPYMRGHHVRQIEAHAAREVDHEWGPEDYDLLCGLLPGTRRCQRSRYRRVRISCSSCPLAQQFAS